MFFNLIIWRIVVIDEVTERWKAGLEEQKHKKDFRKVILFEMYFPNDN